MSSNRIRHLLVAMIAVLAFSAVAAAGAQAARPVQPTYFHFGSTIPASLAISDSSNEISRLWSTEAGLVIVCTGETSTGTIEPKGRNKEEVTYTGCKVFKPEENTKAQWEEGAELTKCTVRSPGEAVGTIKPKPLKSRLVWVKGENRMLTDFEPAEGTTFVEIEILGAECAVKGTFKVTGSALGWVLRFSTGAGAGNEEATMQNVLFETLNRENGKVVQRFTAFEVEEGGVKVEGTDSLKLGAKEAQLESAVQVELNRVSGKRGLWAAHE